MIGAGETGVRALAPRILTPLGVGAAQVAVAGPAFRELIIDRLLAAREGRDPILNLIRRGLQGREALKQGRISSAPSSDIDEFASDLDVVGGGMGEVLRKMLRDATARREGLI